MTIEVNCQHCDRLLAAPDAAAGRQARCPSCNELIEIPDPGASDAELSPVFDAEEYPDDSPYDNHSPYGPMPPPQQDTSWAPPTGFDDGAERNCPMCGERIKAVAIRCRYCGEQVGTNSARPQLPPGELKQPQTGMVLGITSLLFICIPIYSVPIGIAAIFVSLNELGRARDLGIDRTSSPTTGLICGSIASAIWVLVLIALLAGAALDFPDLFDL